MEEKEKTNDLMIREIRNYVDKNRRRVVAYINPEDEKDITYMGHGFTPAPGIKQVFPFEFEIKEATSVKEAFEKYDELFKDAAEEAKRQLREQMFANKSNIVTPGKASGTKIVNDLINKRNMSGE